MSDAATVAARVGALAFDLEVVSISEPVPSVRRVRVSGPGLEAMDPKPGQDVMLAVAHLTAPLSVRAYDAAGPWVDLDFVLHGDGPAVTWASRATPGASIGVIGPRGKVAVVDEAAQWHLFAGDDTFVAATFSMVESLAADRRAVGWTSRGGSEQDQQALSVVAALDGPRWLHRRGGPQGGASLLLAALEELTLPEGPATPTSPGSSGGVRPA